jgi:hypothetical protein
MSTEDIVYYNLTIGNNNVDTPNEASQKKVPASIDINNNVAIIKDPSQYYAGIVRMQIPCSNIPLIQFLIQTPVLDINKGIYSFSIGGPTSAGNDFVLGTETFFTFVPQITVPSYLLPPVGTPTQTFSDYYYLYDYTWFIQIMNTALKAAVISYYTAAGIAQPASYPYFNYDATTQLISLYTLAPFQQQFGTSQSIYTTNPIIYFNNPLRRFFGGLSYNTSNLIIQGLRPTANNYIVIIPNPQNTAVGITTTSYQYNQYGYWAFLKNIVISTNMNVNSEIFYINNSGSSQNVDYLNVLTDFAPDYAVQNGAGLESQVVTYNAPSLYRLFSFNQNTPLYAISLQVNLVDNYNNLSTLQLDYGEQASFKIMFIKKSIYSGNMASGKR